MQLSLHFFNEHGLANVSYNNWLVVLTRSITDLQTDECSSGLGAFFKGDWFYSNLLVDAHTLAHLQINYKASLCVVFAAQRCASSWCNKTALVYCDYNVAVAKINKGSTRNQL